MKLINFHQNKLSQLALGTVQFGLHYGISNQSGQTKQNETNLILKYLWENGVNTFDTAQAYGDAEKSISYLSELSNNTFIISKLSSNMFENNLEFHLNTTLQNLKANSLFGLLLHDTQLLPKWNKAYSEKVTLLKKSKKISYFGVSIYTSEDFHQALKIKDIEIIQIPFNIFDQRATQEDWFKKAEKHNKLLIIRSVFLQGLLLMQSDDLPKNIQSASPYLEKLTSLATMYNISKANMAIHFVKFFTKNSLILFGCENLTQAKENLELYNAPSPINSQLIKQLQEEFCCIEENIYNPSKWGID